MASSVCCFEQRTLVIFLLQSHNTLVRREKVGFHYRFHHASVGTPRRPAVRSYELAAIARELPDEEML